MNLKKLIVRIDTFLCKYLLLQKQQINPIFVSKKDLRIQFTENYRRHLLKCNLKELDFDYVSTSDQTKLGIALGKAVATDFVVSFSPYTISEHIIS